MNLHFKFISLIFLMICGTSVRPVFAGNSCGNGALDEGEFCDPGMSQPSCTTASLLFSSGRLGCLSTCEGYEISDCVSNQNSGGTKSESVIPAFRNAEKWGDAICSYGDPFSFEVSLAPTLSKNWVIFLSGGGQCDGVIIPCTTQKASASKPADDEEKIHQTSFENDNVSILKRSSIDNPDFYNANFVRANYCTNDLWSGTRTDPIYLLSNTIVDGQTTQQIMPMTFAGRNNIRSMLETLKSYYGINDGDSELKIMFTGSSAGGVGVSVTADLLRDVFKKSVKDQRVYVVPSAGWLTYSWNHPNYTLNGAGYSDEDALDIMSNQYQSQFSQECEKMAVNDGKRTSVCFSGLYSYLSLFKKLNLRVLVHRNLLDQVYMNNHLLPQKSSNLTPDEISARKDWEEMLEKELKKVKWLWAPRDPQVLKINPDTQQEKLENNFHVVYLDDIWSQLPPEQISMNTCDTTSPITFRDMIHHFWTDHTPYENLEVGERYCYEGNWIK